MKNKKLYKKLGMYLRECRLEASMTQAELATKLGYSSPQFCSNIERGLCKYPDSKLKKVVRLVGADNLVVFDLITEATQEHYMKLLRVQR